MTQAGAIYRWFLPVVISIAGLCFYNLSVTGFDLQYIPGDSGDARFIHYLLEHGYQSLQGPVSFWDAPFMYPQENVLAFSDNMMGTLPVYGLFRLLGSDSETAYQLWWMSMSLLNFFCCYLVLYRLSQNVFASALGAFIFAFGLFNQSQMSYLQMNIRFAVPFIFYYAWQMVVQPSTRNYLQYCLWLLIQFYSIIYTGFMAFYLSLLFMFLVALVHRRWNFIGIYFTKKNVLYTLGITLVTAAALYLLFRPYIEISSLTGLRLFKEVVPTLPMLSAYFFSHESSYTWFFLSQHLKNDLPDWYLHNIFPGLLPYLAFVASGTALLYQRIRKQSMNKILLVFFLLSAITFLLFIRTENGYTLYALLFKLPGMNSLRVLSRVMHVQLFFLVVLLMLLLVYALQQARGKKKYVLGTVFFLAVLADNFFDPSYSLRTPKQELQARTQTLVNRIKTENIHEKKVLALVNESPQPAYLTHLDAMLAAQVSGMFCVNGYSSYCPADFGPFFLHPGKKELEQWLAARKIPIEKVLILEVK